MALNRRLHWFPLSGHSHRAELFLNILGLPFKRIEVDLRARAHKQPEFLMMNAFGQVPVLEDAGSVIADSNAILVYLALSYDPARRWLPESPRIAAEVQRWLSAAAGPLLIGPCRARLVGLFGAPYDLAQAQAATANLFAVMEGRLVAAPWLASEGPTIADLAMYTYTAHAPEGYVPLEPWPAIGAWLARVEALPGFVPMLRSTPRPLA
jgi:glutathione S-transferase